MTAEELYARINALGRDFKAGKLTNTQFITELSWITFVAQGVPRPSASQLHQRMAEVEQAARFSGPNPTPEEIDAACAFISRAE